MAVALVHRIAQVRRRLALVRDPASSIGFVPTMGALHAGHTRLIDQAKAECQSVVVSIFVNPLQFERADDLERYPRTLREDLDTCAAHGVDVVFAPDEKEMYPRRPACVVGVERLADHLCGPSRPGHFRAVATVVMKLLQIVQPDRAYFGEKDAQQLAIVRRMVADLNLPVTIVGVPTVRDTDGLALSSRNKRLDSEERPLAGALYGALREAERQIAAGVTEPAVIGREASARIPPDPRLRLEYLEVVEPDELQPVERISGPVLVAGALWVGSTRLIDNLVCNPPAAPAAGG
jgi:pantoate--beta-alanine ligase